ncbi:hypothetical protein EV175_005672 [Coemansia sp. RSA 1933]|nr:hypothetical protein EV175_005672 [Coemansia sp. RSA 1933]
MTLSDLLLKKYGPKPLSRSFRALLKSIVERRIINASAEIRKSPNWKDLVDDETEHQCWSAMAAQKFGTTPKDMGYIFAEFKYYKTLHESCPVLAKTIPLVEQVLTDLVHPISQRVPIKEIGLREEKLQVVVEMQNIQLTPDEPEVASSDWINSGIPTNEIVAMSMWYYDVENVAISDMEFRAPIGESKKPDHLINSELDETEFSYVHGEKHDTPV